MKSLANILVAAAVVSLVVGIASRLTLKPLAVGLEASAFLRFTDTCLLFAITLSLLSIVKSKS